MLSDDNLDEKKEIKRKKETNIDEDNNSYNKNKKMCCPIL